VVTLPLSCVVPPVFVVKLVAVIAFNDVVPVLFNVKFPKVPVCAKVILLLPASKVKSPPLTLSL